MKSTGKKKKISGPHGTTELGFWTRNDGSKIFLTWTPASGWVDLWDGVDPDNLQGSFLNSSTDIRHLVKIPKERMIWKLVGGGKPADHLGGNWSEPAEDVLARFRAAGV